jgi:predicted Zn-dependent protease
MRILKRIVLCFVVTLLVVTGLVGCSTEARKSRLLKSADNYFAASEYDKAKIEYLNVLKEDPQNATAIERLGTIWLQQGSPVQAVPFLLAAKRTAPENIDIRAKVARVLLYAGQFEDARSEVLAILELSPSHPEAMRLLIDASLKKEDLEDAERRLQSLSANESPGYHIALATLSFRKGDLSSVESQARLALALDPLSIEGRLVRARLYLIRNDLAGADRDFKAAAELAPPRSVAHLSYAEFKMRTGAMHSARELLTEATRKAPDFLPAWRLLAQIAIAEKKI